MNFYLNKYGFLPAQLDEEPIAETGIIVVIPCFNEPDLIRSLDALYHCEKPVSKTEVIVVLNAGENHSEEIKKQNDLTKKEFYNWLEEKDQTAIRFFLIDVNGLPEKHAGVGLARKIGMDEAVHRFDLIQTDGIIACFDADAVCDKNYLTELERHFHSNVKTPGCSVYFEHPVQDENYDAEILSSITEYELHLRYYNQSLRFCQLPYAYHTIGSSMAVRSSAYQKQGGMNKRKAGEDFYFLHKIISLGNFSELNSTRIIPSPRISDRVPFGTGRAMGEMINQKQSHYLTYNFGSFQLIKEFTALIPQFYRFDSENVFSSFSESDPYLKLKTFLDSENFEHSLIEIRKNSSSEKTFIKRFFVWFDAFRVLKLVHYLRDNLFEDVPVQIAAGQLLQNLRITSELADSGRLLKSYRKLDREGMNIPTSFK